MASSQELVEQRKHKRLRVRGDWIVILRPADTGVGRVIDISWGGVRLECVSWHTPPIEAAKLDIWLTDYALTLCDVPCRSIWDEIIHDYGKPLASVYWKRYGAKFGELTQAQISTLAYFIENHTIGEVEV
jgi:hypothetical protein